MQRFDELKVGDKITARYYENVVVRLKKPGEAAVDVDSAALTRGQGKTPAGTLAAQRTITVTITAMDPKARAVTVKGPNGYNYSRKVADKKTTVVDGPFAESKELIAGFIIMSVPSVAATQPWTSRFADVIGDIEMDVLPLYEPEELA